MLKGYLKKKKTDKNKLKEPKSIVQQQKDKSRKRQKVSHWIENGNFVQHTLSPFLSHFLSILERLNFGSPKRKQLGLTNFLSPCPSQPNTLPTHFLSYFPLSFFHPP